MLDRDALCVDLGADVTESGDELLYVRTQLVLACRVAGLRPPIDGLPPRRGSSGAVELSTARARAFGLFGRLVADPRHLPIVNAVFTPSAEQLERARAQLTGDDAGLAARARAMLALAEHLTVAPDGPRVLRER
jgi:citrate lyase subunit beta/citryl-CoA lyase